MYPAHRVSWEIHNGDVPAEINVLHHCDNSGCVNPAHLYVGTQKQNVHDMFSRNRNNSMGPRGEAARAAKLSDVQVETIRMLYASGVFSVRWIKQLYGVTQTCIWKIVNRRTWRHVA